MELNGNGSAGGPPVRPQASYAGLFRRFVLLTLVCSVLPLLLVGWGTHAHYAKLAESKIMGGFRTLVEHHTKIIELFLKEQSSKLRLLAQTCERDDLVREGSLKRIFEQLNAGGGSMLDLGVIDAGGAHLAYVGPYDLMDKNYSEAFWFREVLERGLYISDMFLGFRRVPHFVIAATGTAGGEPWILRATVDTERFRSLVEHVAIGATGEVYLVNREGLFQTRPRFAGEIMEPSGMSPEEPHEEIRVAVLSSAEGPSAAQTEQVVGKVWLDNPRWMLVVKQDLAEAFEDVNRANFATLVFLLFSAATILAVTVIVVRHMIAVIRRRDAEAETLNRQLTQAGKLASIGELSAGVAHEINNPLAIIATERQILLDLEGRTDGMPPKFKTRFDDSMRQIDVQIGRCKRITQNLLRFSRRTESVIEAVDVNAFLDEVIDLVEREAAAGGIRFERDFDPGMPPMKSDPSQLQQVFLNLLTNAIDAHEGLPRGRIRVATKADWENGAARIVFADTGKGIAAEHLDRIFDPFFTTKPAGKGTGLGLSICYSIARRLGGTIAAQSSLGEGTDMTVVLPFSPPAELLRSYEKHAERMSR